MATPHPVAASVPEAYWIAWDPDARADLLEIVRFIAHDSPAAARRVADRLAAGASSLGHLPQRGRRVPELAAWVELEGLMREIEIRELVIRPWRLVYVIAGQQVRIVALVDSRRDMVAWLERHIVRLTAKPGR